MKTGMNLLLWATHVTEEHFPILADLNKAGFDGVEIPVFEATLPTKRSSARNSIISASPALP